MITALLTLAILAPVQDSLSVRFEGLPGFERSVSVRARLNALPKVFSQLKREGDPELEVDPKVAELKLTARVEGRSIGWTLDRFAEVLDLEWRKTKRGFALVQPAQAAAALEETNRRIKAERLREASERLNSLASSARVPFDKIGLRLEALGDARTRVQHERKPGWSAELERLNSEYFELQRCWNESDHAFGRCLALDRGAVERALASGRLFVAATFDLSGALKLSSDFARQYLDPQRPGPIPHLIVVAKRETDGELDYALHLLRPNAERVETHYDVGPLWLPRLPTAPKRLAAWGQTPSEIEGRLAGVRFEAAQPYEVKGQILSDVLLKAAESSKVDLIADGLHVHWEDGKPLSPEAPKFWSSFAGRANGAWVRIDKGAVLFRHAEPWVRRPTEIPEAKLAAFQESFDRGGEASLNQIAEFVGGLSQSQRDGIAAFPPFRSQDGLGSVSHAMDVLVLWSKLGAHTQAAALRHEVVRFQQLAPAARLEFRRILEKKALNSEETVLTSHPEVLIKTLSGDLSGMAFLVEPAKYASAVVEREGARVYIPIEQAPPGSTIGQVHADLWFYFGLDAKRSFTRTLELPFKIR